MYKFRNILVCEWQIIQSINQSINRSEFISGTCELHLFWTSHNKKELQMTEISLLELRVEHLLRLGKILSIEKYVHLCSVKLDEHLSNVLNDTIFQTEIVSVSTWAFLYYCCLCQINPEFRDNIAFMLSVIVINPSIHLHLHIKCFIWSNYQKNE